MNCQNCSTELPADAVFCHRCGISLDDLEEDVGETRTGRDRGNHDSESFSRRPATARRLRPSGSSRVNDDDDPELDLWEGSYSPKAMLSTWIAAALLTILAFVITAALGPAAPPIAWLILLGLVALAWALLGLRLLYMRLNYQYRLTTQRFIHKSGILRRVTNRIEVIDIDDVVLEQGLIDRFVGVGTVRIDSSDLSHEQLVVAGIDNIKDVADKIYGARRRERVKRGLHIEAV